MNYEAGIAEAVKSQLIASIRTLRDCIDSCPDAEWQESHGDAPFSQVAFHALFFCDYYLSDDPAALKGQEFHKANAAIFADYEELEDRRPVRVYEREFIDAYCAHCEERILALVPRGMAELLEPEADIDKHLSRLERYINLTRHIQHHAAQLGLRLQQKTGREMPWFGRGEGE